MSSSGIIYRKSNPRQIFIEMKDDGHPIQLVRRQLCPIGGNWIGPLAEKDKGPRDLFVRELGDELSFDRPNRNSIELDLLGHMAPGSFGPMKMDMSASEAEVAELEAIKAEIIRQAQPFCDFLCIITKGAMDSADAGNRRGTFYVVSSYFTAGLDEEWWLRLVALQMKFNNLSNESLTMITSLDDIIRTNTKCSFGHDGGIRAFFESHGFEEAKRLPQVDNVFSVPLGPTLETYEDYTQVGFEIIKRPR